MDFSEFNSLSIEQLGEYLENKGVSNEAILRLEENKVSGLAMLLVDEVELKELLPTIGDRAIVKNLLKELRSNKVSLLPSISFLKGS